MDSSRPGSSVHGILRPRILEWVAMSSSRGSSWPRIESGSPALQAHSLLSEPPGKPKVLKDHVFSHFILAGWPWVSETTILGNEHILCKCWGCPAYWALSAIPHLILMTNLKGILISQVHKRQLGSCVWSVLPKARYYWMRVWGFVSKPVRLELHPEPHGLWAGLLFFHLPELPRCTDHDQGWLQFTPTPTPQEAFYCQEAFHSVQFSCSGVSDSATPWTAARQASLSITNSWSLLTLMSIELVMPSIHLIFCHPLLLLPSIFPSIRVFSNESVLPIRWPKYCLSQLLEPWCPLLDKDWKTSPSLHC